MQTGSADFAGTKRFQVVRRLGAGGMGVVYDALDRDRNVRVALKALKSLDGQRILRFKNEFRSLQDLQHPNLASLGELFEEAGQWFFTMELVRGVSFLKYVRPAIAHRSHDAEDDPTVPIAGPDETRLRAALSQLAKGLVALHAAGKIHRDIKPSNIMVTGEGRVVLLDFGLVTELVDGQQVTDVAPVGTTAYMAPEQAASKPLGAEADWYSVGVLLYQALTGQLPFQGPALEIMMDKQRFEPPPPRALVPQVAPDLDALCVELLRFEPKQRPSGREVLRRLGIQEPSVPRIPITQSSFTQTPPFVGREAELRELRTAHEAARQRAATIFIEGESGVGKSMLVRQFTEQVMAEDPDALVFSGRCYERESVPYKAFDAIIDAVSRHMSRLPPVEAAALLPMRASLLAQVFPVLRQVPAIAEAPRAQTQALDPQELRSRIFAALRELFYRLAERRPVILVTEDVQWADGDSWALLAEVMRPPDAPTLLLIATRRGTGERVPLPGDVKTLRLGPLGAAEARTLAGALAERAALDPSIDAETLAAEAGGHPLFIDELVRHAMMRGARAPGLVRLEDALWARIEMLEPEARRLLELVVVADLPLEQDAARRALECDFAAFTKHVSVLRVGNFVRAGSARESIEPYHDRVRDAVSGKLDGERRRQCHERLALALEASNPIDPQALAVHWEGAGARERAADYAISAGDRAAEAFAFDRAAQLYRRALELRPQAGEPARRLRARLGHALANAGRGAEAAEAYLAAAEGANEAEALDLRRRAAEQLLRSGHVDEGLAALERVLAAVGMKLPRTPQRALALVILRRLRMWLGGTRFRLRDASQIAPNELVRVDICWSVATTLSTVDPIRGFDFVMRHMQLALRAGEPSRIAHAFCSEAAVLTSGGERGARRGAPLLEWARQLAEGLDQPFTHAYVRLHDGACAFLAGSWRPALEQCDEAERMFRERCAGVAREVGNAQLFSCSSLYALGEINELCRRVSRGLQEAIERGDRTSAAEMRTGLVNFAWLVQEGPQRAREHTAAAIGQWSQRGFHLQHAYDFFAQAQLDLYEGNAATAQGRVERNWPQVSRSLVLKIQPVRIFNFDLLGRCALAGAIERGDPALLRTAERHAGRIGAEKRTWAAGLSTLLSAGVAAARNEREASLALYRRAAEEFEQAGMRLHAAVARRRMGETAEADRYLLSQRIRDPERVTAMLAPSR